MLENLVAHSNPVGGTGGIPTLVEVGPYPFPSNSACSRRVLATAQLAEMAGYRMVLGSGDPTTDGLPLRHAETPFELFHLSENPKPSWSRARRLLQPFCWGERTAAWISAREPRPTAVVQYGGYSAFCWHMLRCLHPLGIPLVLDVVEWYQPSHIPGGRFGPYRLDIELAIRRLYPKAGNIIAISRLLQRYYEDKGCHVLYLPAVLDVAAVTPRLEPASGGPLRIAYTGTPGRKDLLDPLVEALLRRDPEGYTIRFEVVGPSPEILLGLPALRRRGMDRLPGCLEAPGPVTNAEAMVRVRAADFSLLLRHRQRYAMAGFPTKVPESLAVGTPILGNLTSDLGEYLEDGVEALVCSEPSPEACMRALDRAAALGIAEKRAMRLAARRRAETSLDYRIYTDAMKQFLAGLRRSQPC